ncbi:MAG: extracellular solute-binding protein [Anaerolineales bacterium]|jgi:arabinogalactan oligomer/maltooligosaccharide transport system substrate-binding protein
MSKKFWSILSLLLIATLLIAACGQATPEPEEPAAPPEEPAETEPPEEPMEEVTITVWHQWEGDYLNAISAVFDAYMAEHPNVTITLDKPESVSDALNVAIPAGEGPDIIGWANDQIGGQALVGNIIPFDAMGVDQAFLESNYSPPAVKGVVWQDQIWGLPESVEGIAVVYNKAIASEADFPSDPFDFDDLLAKAEAYQAANDGVFLVCNQGLGNADAYHVGAVYFGHGMPDYVDDQGNVYLDTPEGVAAAEWMTNFSAFAPTETSHEICQTMIVEGQAAAWWTGPWAIATLETEGIDYGILPMGSPFTGVKVLMISKNAADRGNAEVALDIIKFFTNEENSVQLALANKTIPANSAAFQNAEVQALATIAGFGASLENGVPMANTPFAGAQWGPVGDATMAVWTGAQAPAEAMTAGQAAIEAGIAEMK